MDTRESIKVDRAWAERVRLLAAKHGWTLASTLERVITVGCRELEFPIPVGEAAVMRSLGHVLVSEGAPYELRVGIERPEDSEFYIAGAKQP